MATRRMFSKRITESARLLRLPPLAQLLYFHLGMQADDDGVVEAFNVLRLVACSEDDLVILEEKGFIKVLNEDLVTYIYDWKENNQIRPDRKVDSIYQNLVRQQVPEADFIEPKARADAKKSPETLENTEDSQKETNGQPKDGQRTTNGQPTDNQRSAQVRVVEVSIGEVSSDEGSVVEVNEAEQPQPPEKVTTFIDYQKIVDIYHAKCPSLPKIKALTSDRKQRLKELLSNYSMEQLEEAFDKAQASATLRGECNGKGYERFIAGLDWIIDEKHFAKILEGKYDPRAQPTDSGTDYASMEADLLENL